MYICARFSSGEMTNMKEAFFKLHLSVLLAGATGIFGRLISLNEGLLVWYRMLLAGLLFALLSAVRRRFPRIGWKEIFKIGGIGILLGLHWVFFLWEYQSFQHLHRCSLLFTGQFFHGFSGTLDQPSPHLCQRSTFQPAYPTGYSFDFPSGHPLPSGYPLRDHLFGLGRLVYDYE